MTLRLATVAAALMLLTGGSALAQTPPNAATALDTPPATTEAPPAHPPASPQVIAARKAARQACAADVKSFCADVQEGHGGVMKCLRVHAGQVSPPCRDAGQALRDVRHAERS